MFEHGWIKVKTKSVKSFKSFPIVVCYHNKHRRYRQSYVMVRNLLILTKIVKSIPDMS